MSWPAREDGRGHAVRIRNQDIRVDTMPVTSAAVPASVINGAVAVIAGSTVGDAIAIVDGAFCSFVELSCSKLTCVSRVTPPKAIIDGEVDTILFSAERLEDQIEVGGRIVRR
jgi:hypothetical protein